MVPEILLDIKKFKPYINKRKVRKLNSSDKGFTISDNYIVGFAFRSRELIQDMIYSENWYKYSTPCYTIMSNKTEEITKIKCSLNDFGPTQTVMLSELVLLEYEKWAGLGKKDLNEFINHISKKYNLDVDVTEFYNSKYWKNKAEMVRRRTKPYKVIQLRWCVLSVLLVFLTLYSLWWLV